jgi:hypothetical protein
MMHRFSSFAQMLEAAARQQQLWSKEDDVREGKLDDCLAESDVDWLNHMFNLPLQLVEEMVDADIKAIELNALEGKRSSSIM